MTTPLNLDNIKTCMFCKSEILNQLSIYATYLLIQSPKYLKGTQRIRGGESMWEFSHWADHDLVIIKQSAQYLESSILSAFTGRTDEAQLYATSGKSCRSL